MSATTLSAYFTEGYTPSIVLAGLILVLVLRQRLSIKLDPQEPPLLKPAIPYVGHIIGLLWHSHEYFEKLFIAHPLPIATLPMLNSRMYMITSPALIQSVYRSKTLSFDPFMVEFTQAILDISDESMAPIKSPEFLPDHVKEIHRAMAGEHLYKMNANALNDLSLTFNSFGDTFEVAGLYLWLRKLMTMATCNALLGSHNPLKMDPALEDALWDFDSGIIKFVMHVPTFLAPKLYAARASLQAALIEYYKAKHDQNTDVSEMARARAACYRKFGIPDEDIGRFEVALLYVSTTNSIPTFFWNLVFIYSDPEITTAIRNELLSVLNIDQKPTIDGKRQIRIDITKFETHTPLLVSSYRETIRLANSQLGTRRAIEDTIVSAEGKSYLLRKGSDIQLPAGVTHNSPEIWGSNASSFDPRRFFKTNDNDTSEIDKERKRAYFPFGGGKHLCPGRQFAFAEILGALSVLLMGFEVKCMDGELIRVPHLGRARLGEGVAKPRGQDAEIGARITRREGWEDVVWSFTAS